uniref:KRAB domain-containing protein n=1 Tax=Podarcis muralis TaxID=64176 RepID=A0A670KEC3_PODMU
MSLPQISLPKTHSSMGPVCFEDVAVPFTDENLALLDPDQRALQKEVKEDNPGIVASLVRLPISVGETREPVWCSGSEQWIRNLGNRVRVSAPPPPAAAG